MTLLRQKSLVIAIAGLLGGLAIATSTPYRPANALSGQSLVFAEQARSTRDARAACLSYGLSPETLGFHQCEATQIDQRMNRRTLIRYVPPAN